MEKVGFQLGVVERRDELMDDESNDSIDELASRS